MRKNYLRIGLLGVLGMIGAFLYSNDCVADNKYHPTFQVYGGSVFSYGDIKGGQGTIVKIGGKNYIFTSWVEQGAFSSNGQIDSAFSSGAATGVGLNSGVIEGNNDDFCEKRSMLTFANFFDSGDSGEYCFGVNGSSYNGKFGYGFPKMNYDLSISSRDNSINPESNEIPDGVVQGSITGFVKIIASGDLTITEDLKYQNTYDGNEELYKKLEDVPKLLIYANNINIQCNVERVDAVLFAKNNLDTCSNRGGDGVDASKQLVINGAIIAGGSVKFRRTYVANANDCEESDDNKKKCASTPAEIVNYDVSILSTASKANETDTSSSLVTIYQRELPPRY